MLKKKSTNKVFYLVLKKLLFLPLTYAPIKKNNNCNNRRSDVGVKYQMVYAK